MHHTTHEETLQFTAFKLRAPQRLHPSRLQLSPGSKMLFSPAPLKLCFSVLTVFHVLGIPAQILFDSPSFLCVPRPVASWTAVSERSLPGCSSYHSDPWLPIKSLNIKREKQTLLAMVLGSIAMVCRMTEPLWPWSRWLFRKEITLCLIPSISKDQKCCTPLEHEFVPLRLPSTYSRRHRAQNQGKRLPQTNFLRTDQSGIQTMGPISIRTWICWRNHGRPMWPCLTFLPEGLQICIRRQGGSLWGTKNPGPPVRSQILQPSPCKMSPFMV